MSDLYFELFKPNYKEEDEVENAEHQLHLPYLSSRRKRRQRLLELVGTVRVSRWKFPQPAVTAYFSQQNYPKVYDGLYFEDGVTIGWPGNRSAMADWYELFGFSSPLTTPIPLMTTGASATVKEIYSVNETWTPVSAYVTLWTYTGATLRLQGYDAENNQVAVQDVILYHDSPELFVFSDDFKNITKLLLIPNFGGNGTHLGGLSGAYTAWYDFKIEFPDRLKAYPPGTEVTTY